MSLGGFALILIGVACGFLVWRGSHNIWRAILAGLILPPASAVVLASLVGKENLHLVTAPMLWLGMIAVLVALAFIFRK